jgi:hypothetical protein
MASDLDAIKAALAPGGTTTTGGTSGTGGTSNS